MGYRIGIEIGIYEISGVVIDEETEKVIDHSVKVNDTFLPSENFESLQNANQIYAYCHDIVDDFMNNFKTSEVKSIGICGQASSCLYVNGEGNACSPLYTYEDKRGDRIFKNETTYAEFVKRATLRPSKSGYGLITHFYNKENNLVPMDAVKLCTIQAFVAMKLSGNTLPILHTSDAASFGLYDLENNTFDFSAITAVGIDRNILPDVVKNPIIIGEYDRAKVISSVGEVQAAFLGSVTEPNSIVIDIGKHGRVMLQIESYRRSEEMAVKPYFGDTFLLVGTSLCGSKAYIYLKDFFKRTFEIFDVQPPEDLYSKMNLCAFEGYKNEQPLVVDTRFMGAKSQPNVRGKIENIDVNNFTPEALTFGLLKGVVEEFYNLAKDELPPDFKLIGIGNGIRRNTLLQKLISDKFDKPINLPEKEREKAFGSSILYKYVQTK